MKSSQSIHRTVVRSHTVMSYPAMDKTNGELASQTWYFACCNETMGIFSLCVLDFIDINAGSYMYMYFFCIFMPLDIFIWFFF